MQTVTVYSSQPLSTQLSCTFLGLQLVLRPLADFSVKVARPKLPSLCLLYDELERVTIGLVDIGEQLNDHETGRCRLDAGLEQGLRFDRDALHARQRALQQAIKAQKGGQQNG